MNTLNIPITERRAITVKQAVAAYGLGRTTLWRLIKDGEIKATKVGSRTVISVESIEARVLGKAA